MCVVPEDVLMQGYVLATGADIGYRVGYKRYYFVLTDCLYYFETKESFEAKATPVGRLPLEIFSIAKNESRGRFQLAIHAYPLSVEFNLDSSESMKAWLEGFDKLVTRSVLPQFVCDNSF
ncbi:hypothetical protein WA556_003256 [Blastocystis sp. ATCC 50177/Nand II]